MLSRKTLITLIPKMVFMLGLFTIATSMQLKTGLPVANTTFWWIVQSLTLLILFSSKQMFMDKNQNEILIFIKLYILWNIICSIRGVFIAENYWDWKALVGNFMALMVPISSYISNNIMVMHLICRSYIKYCLPFFALIFIFIEKDGYGYYLAPISMFLLFYAGTNSRIKMLLFACSLIVIFADYDARSNVIKVVTPMLFGTLYYFRHLMSFFLMEWIRRLLFILPIVLFSLAITDVFNVFKFDEYINIDLTFESDSDEIDLKADTRTFLYQEVLQTADDHNTWWIGVTPARGNKSESFGEDDQAGRGERLANEVGILNVFTWTGIIGVLLHFLIYFQVSYLAVNKSNNFYVKIMGLFVAFRWFYAWIEDFNTALNLNLFFLWLMIGLCLSNSFRMLSDHQVSNWVSSIFNDTFNKYHS